MNRIASGPRPIYNVSDNPYCRNEVIISRHRSSLPSGTKKLFLFCRVSVPQTRVIAERSGHYMI
jgi:hypothetical protein